MNNCIYMIKLLAIAILGILTSACLIEPIQLDSKAEIKGAPEWVNRGSTALSTKEGRIFYGVSKAAPAGDLGLQKSIADDGSVDEIARLLSSYLVEVAGGYRDSDGLGTDQVGDENLSQEVNGTALQRAKYSVEQQVDDAISRQLKDAVAPEHKVETTRLIKEAAVRQHSDAVSSQYEFLRQLDEIIARKIREIVSRQLKDTVKVNLVAVRIIGSWRDPKNNYIWSIAELDLKNVKSTTVGVSDMNKDLKYYFETNADSIFDKNSK